MKNVILIAPPASGKGTQAKLIEDKYHMVHISTGDLLRDIDTETELGSYVKSLMETGALIDDEIIYQLLEERLQQEDCQNGYILDGFPRNIEQARNYEEILKRLHLDLGIVIYIEVAEDVLAKRIIGRRICKTCGAIYNVNFIDKTPRNKDICDKCGQILKTRSDDNIDSFKNRYHIYLEKTMPLVNYYEEKGVLYTINGDNKEQDVFKEIEEILRRN